MSWSSEIWKKSLPVYEAILCLPFIKELSEGSLPERKFGRYIAQDELYLASYGRQLFQFADLLQDPYEKEVFTSFASSSLEGEKAMHQLLIEKGGLDLKVQPSKVTLGYNAHTQAAIDTGVKELALAAILPCNWIYNRVGLDILSRSRLEGNPYKDWILEYGNEEFTSGVKMLVGMIDRWAEEAREELIAGMNKEFLEALRFEYAFWEYGYNGD